MDVQTIVLWIIIGGIAGILASQIMKGGGLALTGNPLVNDIITGIVGAFIGGWVLGALGISIGGGIVAAIINALIGAIILIFGLRVLRRA
jgi:uncharacterized membrane protein YeaQ/YmgE (transglycosylase-associated protein family)